MFYLLGNLLLALVFLFLLFISTFGAIGFVFMAREERRNGNDYSTEALVACMCIFVAGLSLYELPHPVYMTYTRMFVAAELSTVTVSEVEHYQQFVRVGQYDPGQNVARTKFTTEEFDGYWFECGKSEDIKKGSKMRLKLFKDQSEVITYDYLGTGA